VGYRIFGKGGKPCKVVIDQFLTRGISANFVRLAVVANEKKSHWFIESYINVIISIC
jgi:hypothetical protein